jgi:hypothetical protein
MTGRESVDFLTLADIPPTTMTLGEEMLRARATFLQAENALLRQQLADVRRQIDECMRSHSHMAVEAGKRNQ